MENKTNKNMNNSESNKSKKKMLNTDGTELKKTKKKCNASKFVCNLREIVDNLGGGGDYPRDNPSFGFLIEVPNDTPLLSHYNEKRTKKNFLLPCKGGPVYEKIKPDKRGIINYPQKKSKTKFSIPKSGLSFLSNFKKQTGGGEVVMQKASGPGLEITQGKNVQQIQGYEALGDTALATVKDQRPECGCSRDTSFELKSIGTECKSDSECSSNYCEKEGILGAIGSGKCAKIGGPGSVPLGHGCSGHSDCNDPKDKTSGNKSCIEGICIESSKKETLPLDDDDSNNNSNETSAFSGIGDLDGSGESGKKRIVIDDVTTLYKKYLQLPNTTDSEETKDKMRIEDKPDTKTGKTRQKRRYRICDVTNQLTCSKLGKSSSKMKLGSSKNFVTRYKCCNEVVSGKDDNSVELTSSDDAVCLRMTEPNRPKKSNEMRGVCVNLSTKDKIDKFRLERKIPDGSRCNTNINCISNYCQSTTKTCKANLPIITRNAQCSSMNPCMISEECDNGTCYPNVLERKKNKSKTRKSGQICSFNQQCRSKRCTTEKPFRDVLTKYKLKTAKLPIKRMLRLFQNTDCPLTHIKPDEFNYGVCLGNDKRTKKKDKNKVLLEYHKLFLKKILSLDSPKSSLPRLIFFNNFAYDKFDRTASFELFDYTSQTAIMLVNGKYVLAKFYYVLDIPFDDHDEEDYANVFNGHIFCFFVDNKKSRSGLPLGSSLNELSDRIKCYTTAIDLVPEYLKKKNVLYSKFPDEFKLDGVYSPDNDNNSNVLLVSNLCMYEYLVTLLFGEKNTTPLNMFDPNFLEQNKVLLTTPESNNRGFFQYSINYNSLSTFELLAAEKEELLLLYYPGMYKTFDVPFTTAFKCGMTETDQPFDMTNIFFGMDAFDITKDKFRLAFNYWKDKLKTSKFKKSSLHINTKKYIGEGSSFGIKLINKQSNTLDLLNQKNKTTETNKTKQTNKTIETNKTKQKKQSKQINETTETNKKKQTKSSNSSIVDNSLLFLDKFSGTTDFNNTDSYSILDKM